MHILQSRIIEQLIYNESLPYSKLRPPKVESNHFSYHLNQLLKNKFITKLPERGYTLSASGKAYVDRLSYASLKIRKQPKLVSMLCLKSDDGSVLLSQRKHQPYLGMVGYPTGKQHWGERICVESIQREIAENAPGLKLKPVHRGVVGIGISESGQLISHVTAHIFSAQTNTTFEPWENKKAKRFWAKPSEITNTKIIPGFNEINDLIRKPSWKYQEFFFEI